MSVQERIDYLMKLRAVVKENGVIDGQYAWTDIAKREESRNCCVVGHALMLSGMAFDDVNELDDIGVEVSGIVSYVDELDPEEGALMEASIALSESPLTKDEWIELQETNDRITDAEERKEEVLAVIDGFIDRTMRVKEDNDL